MASGSVAETLDTPINKQLPVAVEQDPGPSCQCSIQSAFLKGAREKQLLWKSSRAKEIIRFSVHNIRRKNHSREEHARQYSGLGYFRSMAQLKVCFGGGLFLECNLSGKKNQIPRKLIEKRGNDCNIGL